MRIFTFSKPLCKTLAIMGLILVGSFSAFAQTYYTRIAGVWNDNISVWSTVSHTGAVCSCNPGTSISGTNIVYVYNNVTSTSILSSLSGSGKLIIESGSTATIDISSLGISAGANITVNSGGTLILNGALSMAGSSTITNNGTVEIHGNVSNSGSATITNNSSMIIYGNVTTSGSASFGGSGTTYVTGTVSGPNTSSLSVLPAFFSSFASASGNGLVTYQTSPILTFQPLEYNNNASTVLTGAGTFVNGSSFSPWVVSSNNICYSAGNVGIGICTPGYPLQVVGDANFSKLSTGNAGIATYNSKGTLEPLNFNGNPNTFLTGAGTFASPPSVCAVPWCTVGNAGTTPGPNFVGTTDYEDLEFQVNSQFAGLIDIGNENTFMGYQTGSNTIQDANTGFGYTSLYKNTTGGNNTAIGNQVLYNNTTGGNNTGCGFGTLYQTTGSQNTAVGAGAGEYNTSGSNNTYVGFQAGPAFGGPYDNSTAVGMDAVVTASNQMVFGNSSITQTLINGNTEVLGGSLSLFNSGGNYSVFFGQDQFTPSQDPLGAGTWGIQYVPGSQNSPSGIGGLNFWKPYIGSNINNFGNGYLWLSDNGKIGIGTTQPHYNLDVAGSVNVTGNYYINGVPIGVGGGGGAWNTTTPAFTSSVSGDIWYMAGNVEIGTTPIANNGAPGGPYTLAVCGNITAKDIVVQVGWCDYKFAPDYKRMTWMEKEEYISKNRHLPDVDSSAVIENMGLKVGKNMKGMVSNIEDNTMDIIDLQKENQSLKQQVNDLKNQMTTLKDELNQLINKK